MEEGTEAQRFQSPALDHCRQAGTPSLHPRAQGLPPVHPEVWWWVERRGTDSRWASCSQQESQTLIRKDGELKS